MSAEVIVMANSPGELYALARPVLQELHTVANGIQKTLLLTPCQFASGRELEVARSFRGVSRIVSPGESIPWIFMRVAPAGYKKSDHGSIVYLGGDPLYPLLLSRTLGYPAYAYLTHPSRWAKYFKKCWIPEVIGNLMVDSIQGIPDREEAATRLGLNTGDPVVTFLPGSRPFQIAHLSPLYLKTASLIRKEIPRCQFVFALSPFTTIQDVKKAVNPLSTRSYGPEAYGIIVEQGGRKLLRSTRTSLFLTHQRLEALAAATLCVSTPGTNTAEIAAIGTPMVMILPLHRPDLIPLEGLAHTLGQLPFFGKIIKRSMVERIRRATHFFALPNQKAGEEIVPEIVGEVSAERLAKECIDLIKDRERREAMGRNLQACMGKPGAARQIAEEMRTLLTGTRI